MFRRIASADIASVVAAHAVVRRRREAFERGQFGFHHPEAIEQTGNGFADGVGHQMMIEVDAVRGDAALTLRQYHTPRYADDCHAVRDFADDDGIGTDASAGADTNRSENFGACANDDTIAERWMAFSGVPRHSTKRDAVVERDVIADFSRLADDDTAAVIDEQAAPDTRTGMNVDLRHESRDETHETSRVTPPPLPQTMRHAMSNHGMNARVGGQDFPARACRWITLKYATDVLADAGTQTLRTGRAVEHGGRHEIVGEHSEVSR